MVRGPWLFEYNGQLTTNNWQLGLNHKNLIPAAIGWYGEIIVTITWTETQLRRLNELEASESELGKTFESESSRENAYQKLEKKRVSQQRRRLKEFREIYMRPALCRLESKW